MAIRLSAGAAYGQKGQFVARVTGRDPKFTFAREFLGRKEGKRGGSTTVMVDEPGLYETRDVDRKGGIEDTYHVVEMTAAGLVKDTCMTEDAMTLARLIGDGVDFAEAVARVWPAAEVLPPAESPDHAAQLASVPTEALIAALEARGYRVQAPQVA